MHTTADHPEILKLATGKGAPGANSTQEKKEISEEKQEIENARPRKIVLGQMHGWNSRVVSNVTQRCHLFFCVPSSVPKISPQHQISISLLPFTKLVSRG